PALLPEQAGQGPARVDDGADPGSIRHSLRTAHRRGRIRGSPYQPPRGARRGHRALRLGDGAHEEVVLQESRVTRVATRSLDGRRAFSSPPRGAVIATAPD